MSEGLQKILNKAEELFVQNGVKNTTMDDLASSLGISKKTLYQSISKKEDLVYRTFENHMLLEKEYVLHIVATAKNAIDEMTEIGKMVTKFMRSINPVIINEVKRYYPEAWGLCEEYKSPFLYNVINENIKKGIAQGYYRKDVNADVIAKLYSAKAECIIDESLFPFAEYSMIELYWEFLTYHLRGIASDKGLKYLEKLKTN